MTDWLSSDEPSGRRSRRASNPSEPRYRRILRRKRAQFLKLAAENAKEDNGVVAALRNTKEAVFFFDPEVEKDDAPLVMFIKDVVDSNSMRELGPIGENMDRADAEVIQALVEMTPDEFWKSRAASAVGPLAFQNVDILSVLMGSVSRKNMRTRSGQWTPLALQATGAPASRWYQGSDVPVSLMHALMRQTAMSTDPWAYPDFEKHILHQIMFGVLESNPELIYKSVVRHTADMTSAPTHITPIGVYIKHLSTRSLLRARTLTTVPLGPMETMVSAMRVQEAEVENAKANFDRLLEVRHLTDKEGTIAWDLGGSYGLPLLTLAVNTESVFIIQRIYAILTPEERDQVDHRGRSARAMWELKLKMIADHYDPEDPSEEQEYRYQKAKTIRRILKGQRASPPKRA